jgi:hypothetical protein
MASSADAPSVHRSGHPVGAAFDRPRGLVPKLKQAFNGDGTVVSYLDDIETAKHLCHNDAIPDSRS